MGATCVPLLKITYYVIIMLLPLGLRSSLHINVYLLNLFVNMKFPVLPLSSFDGLLNALANHINIFITGYYFSWCMMKFFPFLPPPSKLSAIPLYNQFLSAVLLRLSVHFPYHLPRLKSPR